MSRVPGSPDEALSLDPVYAMFIEGKRVDAVTGSTLDVLNPATGAILTRIANGGEADVDAAVQAATRAFEDGPWARMSVADRARALYRLAELMEENLPELFTLESLNNGRPVIETRAQLGAVPDWVRYFASLALTQRGETINIGNGYHTYLHRTPVGVCAVIVPFNHPLGILVRGVAPALAAGNTVVIKPSELTPLTALAFARYTEEAGIPAGVINVVLGGREAGAALTQHPGVKKIDFTGGTEAGREINVAGAQRFAKVTTELGGKSPVVVFADAGLDRAAAGVAFGGFIAAGQTCICGSRVLVEAPIYDEFVERLSDIAARIRVGDPFSEQTQMGPLISRIAQERAASYAHLAVQENARVAHGGTVPDLPGQLQGGFFFQPTVIADATNEMRCAQEEIFGPVLVVAKFEGESDALRQANDIRFGLGASIWTRDVARAHRVAQHFESGMVWVNDHHRNGPSMPWGGVKESGSGKQAGVEAFNEFFNVKSVVIRTSADDIDWYGNDVHDRLN